MARRRRTLIGLPVVVRVDAARRAVTLRRRRVVPVDDVGLRPVQALVHCNEQPRPVSVRSLKAYKAFTATNAAKTYYGSCADL